MSTSTFVAANLRRLREERGMTQEQLAAAAGMKMATVYQFEAEKRRPKIGASLDALAAALGVPAWQLLVPPGEAPETAPTAEQALDVLARTLGMRVVKD